MATKIPQHVSTSTSGSLDYASSSSSSARLEEYSKPSMKKLVPLMIDMATNWYELGAILLEEKQEAQLEVIDSTHGSNVRKCCAAMLRYWIDKHPKASWHQLVTALRSPGVDLDSVASKIEKHFTIESTDAGVQSPTSIEFAKYKSVTEAFAVLIGIFIEELRKANFEVIKIVCQIRFDKELKRKISKTTNIYSLFELLNKNPLYLNWMNVDYLNIMALAAGNTRLQGILRDYYTNVVLSKTLGEIWNSLPSFQKTRTKYYDKLRAEFPDQNPDNIKVQDLQNYKPKLAKKMGMHLQGDFSEGESQVNSKPTRNNLLDHVVPYVTPRWYLLGLKLLKEDQESQLDIIESNHAGDNKKCCMDMFRYWLHDNTDATWEQLIEALRSPASV